MPKANRKILILSIVVSISLLLRAANDVILVTLDTEMKRMVSYKDLFALQIIIYYCLFEIIPFCCIVYIISNTRETKESADLDDDERG